MEWKTVKLGDVCKIFGRIGFRGYTNNDFVTKPEDGAITLSPTNIVDGELDLTKCAYINWDKYYESPEIMVQENDILLSKTGTIGRTALVKRVEHPMTINPQFVLLKECTINPRYLSYLLKTPKFQGDLYSITVGSVIATLSQKNLGNIKIDIVDSATQDKIVAILSSLDDKIENNNCINRNLEAQAQALFKSWFVDFEPFGGTMPEDWKEDTIGGKCTCYLGGTPSRAKSEYWNGDIPWINSGEVNKFRIIEGSEYITELGLKKSATKLLPKKTTVLAITGATLGQVSLLEIEACANQSVIGILENEKMPYEFIYPLIVNDIEKIILNQTGGAQQHINKDNVESHNIIIPTDEIMAKYKAIQAPLFETIANNCLESARLAALRDTLLPKLMRGEITL